MPPDSAVPSPTRGPSASAVPPAANHPSHELADFGSRGSPDPLRPCHRIPQHASPTRGTSASAVPPAASHPRSEEHTSELQSHVNLVCRLLLEKKKKKKKPNKNQNKTQPSRAE